MAAAPLPAARQITLPFGTGRRYGAKTTSGCAAATAASKIARRRGRLSVMASRDERDVCTIRLSIPSPQKKPPASAAEVLLAPLAAGLSREKSHIVEAQLIGREFGFWFARIDWWRGVDFRDRFSHEQALVNMLREAQVQHFPGIEAARG